jgi:ABC-type Fe3+ transport system substrate-binding protein
MLARVTAFVVALLVPLLLPIALSGPANAQAWKDEWNATVAKAKGQPFNIIVAGEEAWQIVLAEFSKKFGIQGQATVMRPSQAIPRLRAEQGNGQFVWDAWIGGTSNMVNEAVPAGLLSPLEPYFILPEVKDGSNWRSTEHLFGDSKKHVFTFSNKFEFYVLRNTSVLPNVKFETWADMLNPAFKGKIVSRDVSVPNAGNFAMATMYGALGPDAIRKLYTEQDVKIYENPQQLEQAIYRGGMAISIGLETFLWDKCRAEGGCKDVELQRQLGAMISHGFSVPKNPPNPEAAKLWVNWFLSKEGQASWVKAWASHNSSGAVSMRKDVPPAKGHEQYLPDFDQHHKYVLVSSEAGSNEVKGVIKIFKEVTGR